MTRTPHGQGVRTKTTPSLCQRIPHSSIKLTNAEHRKVRSMYPALDIQETSCPRLDAIFKTTAKSEVKNADAELARIRAFVLDPVGPLTRVLHPMEDKGDYKLSYTRLQGLLRRLMMHQRMIDWPQLDYMCCFEAT